MSLFALKLSELYRDYIKIAPKNSKMYFFPKKYENFCIDWGDFNMIQYIGFFRLTDEC